MEVLEFEGWPGKFLVWENEMTIVLFKSFIRRDLVKHVLNYFELIHGHGESKKHMLVLLHLYICVGTVGASRDLQQLCIWS